MATQVERGNLLSLRRIVAMSATHLINLYKLINKRLTESKLLEFMDCSQESTNSLPTNIRVNRRRMI